MNYAVRFRQSAWNVLQALPKKTQQIIKDKCTSLGKNPSEGSGGQERLHIHDIDIYRLHIGRSYTVIYLIHNDVEEPWVEITHLMSIEQAHKRYGRL